MSADIHVIKHKKDAMEEFRQEVKDLAEMDWIIFEEYKKLFGDQIAIQMLFKMKGLT